MKQNIRIGVLIICLCLLLQGCSFNNGNPISPSETYASNFQDQPISTFAYLDKDGVVYTSDGSYEAQFIFAGSANIFYTDFATRERMFLCARPECTHDNDTCQSYLSYLGTFPPKILHANNKIFAVMAQTDSEPLHVISMDMDGTNKQELFRLDANQSTGGTYITDNKYMYFMVNEVSAEGNAADKLMRASISTGDVSLVYEFENDVQVSDLMGYTGDKLGLIIFSQDKEKYVLCDPDNQTLDEIDFDIDMSSTTIYGKYVYLMDESSQTITRRNIATGEEKTIGFPMKKQYEKPEASITFDENIKLTECGPMIDGNYKLAVYLVDMEKGTCSEEINLNTTYNGRPITPLASYGEYLYVVIDFEEYTAPRMDAEGNISEQTFIANKYAFILREDYENSRPNYIPINDTSRV